jgi:hypothetical protein
MLGIEVSVLYPARSPAGTAVVSSGDAVPCAATADHRVPDPVMDNTEVSGAAMHDVAKAGPITAAGIESPSARSRARARRYCPRASRRSISRPYAGHRDAAPEEHQRGKPVSLPENPSQAGSFAAWLIEPSRSDRPMIVTSVCVFWQSFPRRVSGAGQCCLSRKPGR